MRETETESVDLENRFGESDLKKRKCGVQALDDRIVGGELCEIDEYFLNFDFFEEISRSCYFF